MVVQLETNDLVNTGTAVNDLLLHDRQVFVDLRKQLTLLSDCPRYIKVSSQLWSILGLDGNVVNITALIGWQMFVYGIYAGTVDNCRLYRKYQVTIS